MFIKTFTFTVQEEIDERRGFLKEMEDLGQGGKFRPIIETEISQVKGNNYIWTVKSNKYLWIMLHYWSALYKIINFLCNY